ncbi:hypothetical protein IW140_000363 [Coemansia sp. RSA 1813]|nr:hypothetical protein IW140_000363 [Coemansia sp. RSA 1813]
MAAMGFSSPPRSGVTPDIPTESREVIFHQEAALIRNKDDMVARATVGASVAAYLLPVGSLTVSRLRHSAELQNLDKPRLEPCINSFSKFCFVRQCLRCGRTKHRSHKLWELFGAPPVAERRRGRPP